MTRTTTAVVALLVALASAITVATVPPAPQACQVPERRQFDFWVGHWDVFTPDGRKAGENHIEPIDGGCALIERWRGGGGFTGTSLNSWDAAARVWRQHWVDNQGGQLRLAGGLDGPRMVLASTDPDPARPGVRVRQRITWTPLPDGAVRQHWERSADDGSSWSTVFDGRYVRRAP